MSIAVIFKQIRDQTAWPAAPERPLRPYSASDLRPAEVVPLPVEALQAWAPAPREGENG